MKIAKNIQKIAVDTLIVEADAVRNLTNNLNSEFENSVLKILKNKGRLVISGIGKSAIVGQKIVATLNSTGTRASFLHAAEAIHGDLGMLSKEDIVLLISKSGNSPEIQVLASLLKQRNLELIGMTANRESVLAQKSDSILFTPIDKEACPHNLAPTTSTTVQMAMGDAVSVCLMELKGFSEQDFANNHPGGSLGKQLLMTVDELAKNNAIPLVNVEAGIEDIVLCMSKGRLGCAGVTERNRLAGIITDGDLRRMLQKENFTNIFARDIMTPNPKTISSGTLVLEALKIMRENSINQLIILDSNKETKGFIHLQDILKEGII